MDTRDGSDPAGGPEDVFFFLDAADPVTDVEFLPTEAKGGNQAEIEAEAEDAPDSPQMPPNPGPLASDRGVERWRGGEFYRSLLPFIHKYPIRQPCQPYPCIGPTAFQGEAIERGKDEDKN